MRNRQARAQRGTMAAIKEIEFVWRFIVQAARQAPVADLGHPRRAEPLALDAEVGDLVERIYGSQ